MQLSTRHLLGIKNLTKEDISLILSTAEQFKEVLQRPVKKVPSLRDVTIVNLVLRKFHPHQVFFRVGRKKTKCRYDQFCSLQFLRIKRRNLTGYG